LLRRNLIPGRPITILVPFPGPADTLARILAERTRVPSVAA